MFGPWAKEQPYPCISSSGLVETELQILQWGDGQRGMWPVRSEGKTALQGFNREEILGWYTVKEMQGHGDSNHHTRTSSPKKEGQYLKEDNLHRWHTSHSAYGKKIHCKSVPAQLHHQVRSSAPCIINSSSISTLFQYRWHKMGFITTSPVQPPIATFPPSQTMCDSLSHKIDPNSLFKIIHFSAFIKLLQVQIPTFRHTFHFQIQHLL